MNEMLRKLKKIAQLFATCSVILLSIPAAFPTSSLGGARGGVWSGYDPPEIVSDAIVGGFKLIRQKS